MVAKRKKYEAKPEDYWVGQVHTPWIERYTPSIHMWNACTEPDNSDHQAMTGWINECAAEVCQWCNPTLINARGHLILSWLRGNPQKYEAAVRLLEQAGERVEDYE